MILFCLFQLIYHYYRAFYGDYFEPWIPLENFLFVLKAVKNYPASTHIGKLGGLGVILYIKFKHKMMYICLRSQVARVPFASVASTGSHFFENQGFKTCITIDPSQFLRYTRF